MGMGTISGRKYNVLMYMTNLVVCGKLPADELRFVLTILRRQLPVGAYVLSVSAQ